MMIPKSLSDWIENCKANDTYSTVGQLISQYKYIYNMDVCNTFEEVYSNSWNMFFEDEVYCFAHSDYGLGTFSLLAYDISSGKIKKYLCDAGGSKESIMEFDDIRELLEYDSKNIYPSYEEIINKRVDWKLRVTHVFM